MAYKADRYWFFVSYARGDADEAYVERFTKDLEREIRVGLGLPLGDAIGFLDVASVRVGTGWRGELTDALATCRTFLPLYTPGYFVSEQCAREWALFSQRLNAYRSIHQEVPNAILPVVWYTPTSLPARADGTG
jgi:hypothetical protein